MHSASPAKVLLLIPHLGGGGAEHVAATLAQHLSREKYDLYLGLVTQTPPEASITHEQLPLSVHVHALGARRVRSSAWLILKLIWRIKPAVVLSGMAHLNLLVLLLRPFFPAHTRVLVRQNGAISATFEVGRWPRLTRLLFRVGYRQADRVICQTKAMAQELRRKLDVDEAKLVVLNNPVDILGIRKSALHIDQAERLPRSIVLAVTRLAPEKGVDTLLDSFADIKETYPSIALRIAGTGPCKSALKTQCRDLGIGDSVDFLGHVESPMQLFSDATVFVLSSRHEGLPNALLEAAAAGLPIVATPASRGIVDLLRDKPGVWLAGDTSVDALQKALRDALATLEPQQRFPHHWIEPFNMDDAIRAYECEIDRCLLETQA